MSSSSLPHGDVHVPFKFRRKSLSNDTPDWDSCNLDSSSPIPSSPLPATPVASSSSPGQLGIQNSFGSVSGRAIVQNDYDYDDISAAWGRGHHRHGGFMKSMFGPALAAPQFRRPNDPSKMSGYDASELDECSGQQDGYSSDDTDGEDEEFGDVCQTRFAISSERGRWKSSPIPIKTHSRGLPSKLTPTSPPREKSTKPKSGLISSSATPDPENEWRLASTSSHGSDYPEPSSGRRAYSPLPPSSPPMSPISAMPDIDYTTEEDMLMDFDEEPQHSTQSAKSTLFSLLNPINDLSQLDSDSKSKHQNESLIPEIATLSFATVYAVAESVPSSPQLTPELEVIALPRPVAMPTPEPTPTPQERPQTLMPASEPLSTASTIPVKPAPFASIPSVPTSPKQPLANKKNVPHAGQDMRSAHGQVSRPPSTHISTRLPTPMEIDANVRINTAITSRGTSPTAIPSLTPVGDATSAPLAQAQPMKKISSTQRPVTPLTADIVSAGPSGPAKLSSIASLSRKSASTQLQKAPHTTKKKRSHRKQGTLVAQVEVPMVIDATPSTSSSSTEAVIVNEDDVLMDTEKQANRKRSAENAVEKSMLPARPIKRVAKKQENAIADSQDVAKLSSTSKSLASANVAPKASSSKRGPMLDKTAVATRPMNGVAKSHGKGKVESAKRKLKAQEKGEGPSNKKLKVAIEVSVAAEPLTPKDGDAAIVNIAGDKIGRDISSGAPDHSSSKSKTKKSSTSSHVVRPPGTSSTQLTTIVSTLEPTFLVELQGMIIEAFAVSRASSLPASSLYNTITGNRPSLKTERTKEGWLDVLERALEDGRSTTGVFGKIESSFKDASDRALEAKWFYVPERDRDQDRATLISSMMPRAAKRTETKKYKQYYFQPLDKISRWDPEDDL